MAGNSESKEVGPLASISGVSHFEYKTVET